MKTWIKFFMFAVALGAFNQVRAEGISKDATPRQREEMVVGDKSRVIFTINDSNERISNFNKTATHYGINVKIIGCKLLIDVPAPASHGNNSYGGFCQLQNGERVTDVEICDDNMVGHFSIKSIFTFSKKDLAEFVIYNCYGG